MCQVRVTSPDGHTTRARALLNSTSSASIMECLVQHLHLPCSHHAMKISGIEGASTKSPSWGMVDFKITSLGSEGKTLDVEGLVWPKIMSVLPSHPVPFSCKRKHLTNISLADQDFGTSGNVDLQLGADIFSRAVLHGQWFGPSGTPSAFKTCFGWVLAGIVHRWQQQDQTATCFSTTTVDDLVKWFWEIED